MTEKNSHRIKENIVHISMNAGILLQAGAIEVDSSTLTDTILVLADVYEDKVYESIPEGEYFESIDLFSNMELLKAFHCTDIFPVGSIYHTNTGKGTFRFFLNEEAVSVLVNSENEVEVLEQSAMFFIAQYVKEQGFVTLFHKATFADSELVVEALKE